MIKFNFPFHLVRARPWPFLGSVGVIFSMLGGLKVFQGVSFDLLIWGNLFLVLVITQWWRDVVREATYLGDHSKGVTKGLRIGMILFILSELIFFVSFFWAYFHLFLSPGIEVGGYWPPQIITVFDPYNIPLLNTLILLSSGVSITWCHHCIIVGSRSSGLVRIFLTILLGVTFRYFQYLEYRDSFFRIRDSAYGSIFFLATGFHGFHVLVGTIFIIVNYLRLVWGQFSNYHHFGFEAASWYWHFVDVVWLFLYIFVYWISY